MFRKDSARGNDVLGAQCLPGDQIHTSVIRIGSVRPRAQKTHMATYMSVRTGERVHQSEVSTYYICTSGLINAYDTYQLV